MEYYQMLFKDLKRGIYFLPSNSRTTEIVSALVLGGPTCQNLWDIFGLYYFPFSLSLLLTRLDCEGRREGVSLVHLLGQVFQKTHSLKKQSFKPCFFF